MRLVHRPDPSGRRDGDSSSEDAERTIARDVEVAETTFEQALGLLFRRSIPDDYALVFPFDDAGTRTLHMLLVPFAIDALWLTDGTVTHRKRLRPFVGLGRGTADTVVELPAGAADDIAAGDEVILRET